MTVLGVDDDVDGDDENKRKIYSMGNFGLLEDFNIVSHNVYRQIFSKAIAFKD